MLFGEMVHYETIISKWCIMRQSYRSGTLEIPGVRITRGENTDRKRTLYITFKRLVQLCE